MTMSPGKHVKVIDMVAVISPREYLIANRL